MEARISDSHQPLIPPASSDIRVAGISPDVNPGEIFFRIDDISSNLDVLYESEDDGTVIVNYYDEPVPGEFRINVFRKVGESFLISQVNSANVSDQGIQTSHIVVDRSGSQTRVLVSLQNIASDDEATHRTASVTDIFTREVEVEGQNLSKEQLRNALIASGETVTKDPNAKWERIEDLPSLEAVRSLFPQPSE